MSPSQTGQEAVVDTPSSQIPFLRRFLASEGKGHLRELVERATGPIRWTDVTLVALVAGTGAGAALGVQLFEGGIERLFHLAFQTLPAWFAARSWPQWLPFLMIPFLMGLAVALIKSRIPADEKAHAIPLVIISLMRRDGRIRLRTTLLKTLAAVLTLGSGGSLGREGPVVLLGGGVGSALGQAFRLSPEVIRTLVAAGAGAAIATAFHAPIAGTFFAMEIVLTQFTARAFALVALASVTAATVIRLVVTDTPFPIPAYRLEHPWEVLFYIGLGLVITPVARAYITGLVAAEEGLARLRRLPGWLLPALGGLVFGAVGIILPQTLGGGYDVIARALTGGLPVTIMLILLVAKFFTVMVTQGSGWTGGVFAPAMFLGAMAGGAYGWLVNTLFPGVTGPVGAYAVVGMAAMIAGATHAPLTALTLIFEVTRDYQIALPAMLACGIATVFSQRLSPYSIDTLHLPEHGVVLPWQVHDLRGIPVAEAMVAPVHTVRAGMTLAEVIALMQRHRHGGFPVLDAQDRLVGMLTLKDIRDVPLEGRLNVRVEQIMSRDLEVATPEQSLADAALAMARRGIGRLPVVASGDRCRLVGILTRSDILRAYQGRREDELEKAQCGLFDVR